MSDNRLDFAKSLQGVTKAELLQYGITRVADITDLDRIGIPVYTATRPLSSTISISAGKGTSKLAARAGAIMESVEMNRAETPAGEFVNAPYSAVKDSAINYKSLPISRNSILHDNFPIPWEPMQSLVDGSQKLIPSSLVWMASRVKEYFMHFQMTSNGLASGINDQDAINSALYEVIERDAWTLCEYRTEKASIYPTRVWIDGLEDLTDQLKDAGIDLFLFDMTSDIGVPVFKAQIMDRTNYVTGFFSGCGCHGDYRKAAERAILEAIQSRVCYISAARDDLMRRNFLIMKNIDQSQIFEFYKTLPVGNVQYPLMDNPLGKLFESGHKEVFCKVLHRGKLAGEPFSVVRVVAPGLEVPQFDAWHPSDRARKYAGI
jgi:YcaO-like protein with predicted kinase domain